MKYAYEDRYIKTDNYKLKIVKGNDREMVLNLLLGEEKARPYLKK